MSNQEEGDNSSVGVASLCSPLEVGADGRRRPPTIWRILRAAGCQVVNLGTIDQPDKSAAAGRKLGQVHVHAAVFVTANWFEDYLVFDLLEIARFLCCCGRSPAWRRAFVRRATTDRLSETVRRTVSSGVRAVGVVRLPESPPGVPPAGHWRGRLPHARIDWPAIAWAACARRR